MMMDGCCKKSSLLWVQFATEKLCELPEVAQFTLMIVGNVMAPYHVCASKLDWFGNL